MAEKHLERAATALEQGAGGRALDELIAAWRATRAREIADLVLRLSDRLVQPPIPRSRTQKQELVDWIKRARERVPADLGVLLDAFKRIWARGRASQISPALDELVDWKDDPRLGPWAISMVEAGLPSLFFHNKLRLRFERILVNTGDPSTRGPLENLLEEEMGEIFLPRIIAKLAKRLDALEPVTPLTKVALARCEKLFATIAVATLDPAANQIDTGDGAREQLLVEVYADPSDDASRMVLADQLHAAGDPWGELINLQFARLGSKPTRKALSRERAIIKEHKKKWLGNLARIVKMDGLRFERGFPVAVRLKPIKKVRIKAELEHREWATIEEIEFDLSVNACGSVISGQMKSVRCLRDLCHRGLLELSRDHADLPVEELAPRCRTLGELFGPLEQSDGLRSLRALHIGHLAPGGRVESRFWASRVGQQLETLVVERSSAARWFAARPPVSCLEMVDGESSWRLDRRDGSGRLLARLPSSLDPGETRAILASVEPVALESLRFELLNPVTCADNERVIRAALKKLSADFDRVEIVTG